METNLTCYLIDDQIDSLERLEYLIEKCGTIKVSGKNTNPGQAINEVVKIKPNIVFVDVEMPSLTGFEVIEQIRSRLESPQFIFTTAYSQYAIKAIKASAFDYLLKPIDLDELKQVIKRITLNNPKMVLLKKLELSEREKEVISYIIEGKTSKEIADKLFISKNTVDTHRRNILEKNGLKNIQELILKLK
ncbi:MAG: response regulator [Salinivirgaceae bacterium]